MKVAIVAILVCFSFCAEAQRSHSHGRDGHRPHHRKGPVTPQELSKLISIGLDNLDEKLRKRDFVPLPALNSTVVQSDSANVTLDLVKGKQLLGRTVVQNISVKKTDSSLELTLEIEQEGNKIEAIAAIKGTVNGTEVDLKSPIVIRNDEVSIKASLKADLGVKSVKVTDLGFGVGSSTPNVTLTASELDEDLIESLQKAVSDNLAKTLSEAQEIINENKEKAIESWNQELKGKSLEQIIDEIVKNHHRGHHGRIQNQFQQLLSL